MLIDATFAVCCLNTEAPATLRRMELSDLSPKQLRQLASKMEDLGTPTSGDTLRGIANGSRGASSQRAIVIEQAAVRLGWDIRRESLNAGCEECEFAKQCRKAARAKV
jgi:hypothetical protein